MKIDFKHARGVFEEYLNGYDREDEKIKLKIIHTYGVVKSAREIGHRMHLNEEDQQLAELIALLHDIGRFEQLRLYNSFSPDTMDHAAFGVQLLFEGENPMISRFIEDRSYDDIIRIAIARHSDFRLEGIQDERTLFHAKMIRDADKLDNCRVKLVDSVEAMIGVPQEHAGEGKISPKVWESCLRKEAVSSSDRITSVDYWVSYAAQYYDLNFKETWQIMKEKNYISRIIKRLEYKDKDTREKMEILEQQIERLHGENPMLSPQISYQIIRSSRKTMSLEIKADGSVVVRAPLRLSETKIQKFVEEKQEWILKNLEKIQKRDAQKKNVQKLSALERQHLQNKACVVIPRRVAYYAEKLGVSYGKITLRQQKTRWGSCAANGNLNFNWLLILAPPEVLDYVVVHELCHRMEMNHSQAFWKEVEKILPDYQERQKWLKDNGWRLMEEGL